MCVHSANLTAFSILSNGLVINFDFFSVKTATVTNC